MKVYTRRGDTGYTELFGGRRVAKNNPRVNAYGAVDELNAALGMATATTADAELRDALHGIQVRLFDVGADLASPPEGRSGAWVTRVNPVWTTALEAEIDDMTAHLEPLSNFILPGGSTDAAYLHLARTICRRAERLVVAAGEAGEEVNAEIIRFLNRLGDWLFVAARLANARAGVADIPWQPAAEKPERDESDADGSS